MIPRLGTSSGGTALAAFALLLGHAPTAEARIVATSVAVMELGVCPVSIETGNAATPTSDIEMYAFEEQHSVTLVDPLDVDISTPGVYNSANPLTPGTLAGGCVDSDYVLFQSVTSGTTLTGRVRFAGEIVGVIVDEPTHDDSNYLGCAGTSYGICAGNVCAMEAGTDQIQVGFDFIEVDLASFNWGDRIRVITKAEPLSSSEEEEYQDGEYDACEPIYAPEDPQGD